MTTAVRDEDFFESGSVVNLGQSIEHRYDRRHFGDDSTSNNRKNELSQFWKGPCVVENKRSGTTRLYVGLKKGGETRGSG